MNISIHPVQRTVKDYEASVSPYEISHVIMQVIDPSPRSILFLNAHMFSDNRARFRRMWGKPSFYYRGEFYFHGWAFEVKIHEGSTIFYILTAKGKGTCYEATRDMSLASDSLHAFAKWLKNELWTNPALPA